MFKVEIHGGPSNPQSGWKKIEQTVLEQINRLASHLKFQGDLHLTAAKSYKGGSELQGLRAQRYEPDPLRPAVLLLAQPGDNKTCWMWRLQFPRGTDVQMMYGRMAIAIEEGWHLKVVAASDADKKVVPIRPATITIDAAVADVPQSYSQETGPVQSAGPDSADIIIDEEKMLILLSCVFGNIPSRGRGRTILSVLAIDEVIAQITSHYPHYPRREAGKIVEAFEERFGWIKRNKDEKKITFTDEGIWALHVAGINVESIIGFVPVPPASIMEVRPPIVPPAALLHASPTGGSASTGATFADGIADLKAKVKAFSGAKEKADALVLSLESAEARMKVLDEERMRLRAQIGEQTFELDDLRAKLNDPEYVNARVQLDEIRKVLLDE